MKYIVIVKNRKNICEIWTTEFDTAAEAIDHAKDDWKGSTAQERKKYSTFVLESQNPDEDAEDHLDGTIIWEDGE